MAGRKQGEIFGHPKGLFILFFTEMWERFSYYGMRALLVLYMVNYFKWTQADASSIYKWYTSLVYLTPLIGGYLADRYLGNKKAIIIGASLMAIGHFCMAFEQIEIFYLALVFLIVGNGFFKPNMSTQVGRLYPTNDPRRDSAYTIFYMGINLGAFMSPLICGWLRENTAWGFHAGFAAAGVGMVLGLIMYLVGQKWVLEIPESVVYDGKEKTDDLHCPECGAELKQSGDKDEWTCMACGKHTSVGPRKPETKSASKSETAGHYMTEAEASTAPSVFPRIAKAAPSILGVLSIVCVVGGVVLWFFDAIKLNNAVALGIGGGLSCWMGAWIVKQLDMAVRDRVLAIYIVAVFVVFFWGAFEQAGNSMNLFADQTTNRYITEDAPTPNVFPEITSEVSETVDSVSWGEFLSHGLNPFAKGWMKSARPIVVGCLVVMLLLLWTRYPRPGTDLYTTGKLGITAFLFVAVGALLIWMPSLADLKRLFNPMSTEWFQSINALAIFCLAPFFAWMWLYLPKRGIHLSIPIKVAFGVFMQAAAFMLMFWAITYENQPSSTALATLPTGLVADDDGRVEFRDAPALEDDDEAFAAISEKIAEDAELHVVAGGRIMFDQATGKLDMTGVLAMVDRDRLLRATVSPDYLRIIRDLANKTANAQKNEAGEFTVEVALAQPPAGFDLRYAGFTEKEVHYDQAGGKLIATVDLADKDYKALLVAGSDTTFRDALNDIYVTSAQFKVSSWWLFWFYILCTVGELCLSPVGLSMVSKLAPAKFATMLMGMWLLTSFFGNFFAGFAGESYGTIHPSEYFVIIAAVVGGASVLCVFVVKRTRKMMHGVM